MSMNIKTYVCAIIGAIGGAVSAALGGWDNAIITLIIFMTADFATGIACAIFWNKSSNSENGALSSKACWQGIIKKSAPYCLWYAPITLMCCWDVITYAMLLSSHFVRPN